jgi:hypothetical protein
VLKLVGKLMVDMRTFVVVFIASSVAALLMGMLASYKYSELSSGIETNKVAIHEARETAHGAKIAVDDARQAAHDERDRFWKGALKRLDAIERKLDALPVKRSK